MRRIVVVAAILLAGCSSVPEGTMAPITPPPTPQTSPTPVGPTASDPGGFETAPPMPSHRGTPVPLRDDLREAIVADLGSRDVDAADMVVVSAREVTWNDGSWGCPEPGMAYTQALVPGLHVVVEVDGVQYDYRFGAGLQPRLCLPLTLR